MEYYILDIVNTVTTVKAKYGTCTNCGKKVLIQRPCVLANSKRPVGCVVSTDTGKIVATAYINASKKEIRKTGTEENFFCHSRSDLMNTIKYFERKYPR